MSLNIKNERVHDLAPELARRTGRTQTAVIESALEAYLDALLHDSRAEERERRARQTLARIDARLTDADRDAVRTASDELYDEKTGLPR